MAPEPPPSNTDLAELLARAAEEAETDRRRRALGRASRWALMWPEEAAVVAASGRPLTELWSVGPFVAGHVEQWLGDSPPIPEPPGIRRGFLSLAAAAQTVAAAPGWREALLADLQVHTTDSDGSAPLPEMVRAAADLGHRHVAITDHSAGQRIPRGMDEAGFERQGRAIQALNGELESAGAPIRALRGIEMNLSPAGEGDTDPGTLARLDLVLGAFHSKLRETEDQTGRYLAALANPTIDVLAHPRGRRFGQRLGLPADWARVAAAAAAAGVALEVDAHPDRQDLDVESLRHVRDADGWVSIGTDAHHPAELRFVELGLAAVILAGIHRRRILNFLSGEELAAWGASRRARVGSAPHARA